MALFRQFRGDRASLDAQPLHDGYAYFCVDDGTFHIDYVDAEGVLQRKQINAKNCETLMGVSLEELKSEIATQDDLILHEAQAYTDAAIANIGTGGGATQVSITHSELKELRDNAQLTPGCFYRITDYVCTTTQENTRAMDNKFDIIVQALSEDTLSEIAKADYHYDEDGNIDGYFQRVVSGGQILNIDWVMSLGAGGYDGSNTSLVDIGYEENNEGETVPVIYLDQHDDYEEPDKYFYVGSYEFNDETYDRWRMIEAGTTEGGSHTWDSDDKKFILTNIIVENDEFTIDDVSEIEILYTMYDDNEEGTYVEGGKGDTFVEANYKENNEGVVVPVLYKTDLDSFSEPDYADTFYYVGQYEYGGEVYDRWRKIEDNGNGWGDGKRIYALTNIIVENNQFMDGVIEESEGEVVKVANLPAWEIKYCLDNDTTRFAWATGDRQAITEILMGDSSPWDFGEPLVRMPSYDGLEPDGTKYQIAWGNPELLEKANTLGMQHLVYSLSETVNIGDVLNVQTDLLTVSQISEPGKGVIYYMKDEYNNECPYDFKNIQFIRCLEEDGNRDSGNGEDTWCYTFGGKQCDRSIRHEDLKEYNNNSIGTYYVGCDEVFSMPNNVFLGTSECMTKNNKLGMNCDFNTFGDGCHSNIFGDNCRGNEVWSSYNTLRADSSGMTLEDPWYNSDLVSINSDINELKDVVGIGSSEGLAYTIFGKDQYYTVTGVVVDTNVHIKIPSEYNGKPVKSIGKYAFSDCTFLKSIEIPNGIIIIDYDAFYNCKSLTSITIPDSVTSIDDGAFYGCSSLTSVEIPDSVTSIGNYTFSNCASLKSIVIPDSVTSIGYDAFRGCTSLTSIEIPNSVTSIGNDAFSNCASLKSIEIPDSVTSIGNEAFFACTSLASVVIGDSVTRIDNSTFSSCTSLTSIKIPNSVTSIGSGAFFACTSFNEVYYAGTEEEWNNIETGISNDKLLNATVHYNFANDIKSVNSRLAPPCDSSNEGQFLRVVNGAPAWTSIPNAEDNTF